MENKLRLTESEGSYKPLFAYAADYISPTNATTGQSVLLISRGDGGESIGVLYAPKLKSRYASDMKGTGMELFAADIRATTAEGHVPLVMEPPSRRFRKDFPITTLWGEEFEGRRRPLNDLEATALRKELGFPNLKIAA